MRHFHFFAFLLFLPFLSCQQMQEQAFPESIMVDGKLEGKTTVGAANLVFQSTDGGRTWQDIGTGLPEDLNPTEFFTENGALILGARNAIYRNGATAQPMHWEKETLPEKQLIGFSANDAGMMAISENSRFFQRLNGTGVWLPIFPDFKERLVRSVFTAKDGSIFVGSDNGLFKSTDQGKTWRNIMPNGWVIDMVESGGVLFCTNYRGILRSTDGGEHWEVVLSEGGVGIDLTTIQDGVAAIVYAHGDEARHIHTSKDGGTTWQRIDMGLPPSKLISSIRQVGNAFYCGHPDGIFRSDDGGKTWNLVLPTIGKKVFNLLVSNGVAYAVLREGGC